MLIKTVQTSVTLMIFLFKLEELFISFEKLIYYFRFFCRDTGLHVGHAACG